MTQTSTPNAALSALIDAILAKLDAETTLWPGAPEPEVEFWEAVQPILEALRGLAPNDVEDLRCKHEGRHWLKLLTVDWDAMTEDQQFWAQLSANEPVLVDWARARRDAISKPVFIAPPVTTNAHISVDLARRQVVIDGQSYDVNSENALRWVKVLIEHPGEWITGGELEKYDANLIGIRTDRLRPYLPEELLQHIESEPGIGSRFRMA